MIDVHLVRVEGGNPFFDYPQLQQIWPQPYREAAMIASQAYSTTGQVFYIVSDTRVVGITGYWLDDISDTDVWLRWHGVIPAMRGKGVAKRALKLLLGLLESEAPLSYTRLIELVPDNEYGHTVARPFFDSFGFKPDLLTEPPPDEVSEWKAIPMAYTLSEAF